MSLISDMLAAAGRLLAFYNGDEKTADNPGGMTGVGGMADNWDPCIRDIGTVANGVGEALTVIAASQTAAAGSATAAAGSASAAATSAGTAHTDRLAADAAAAATAADRTAVAADKTAVHADRLAADADAQATAADRTAVAADRTAVATDAVAAHAERLAADASAAAAAGHAAGLAMPAVTVADAGKGLEVKVDGSGWQLATYLKSLAGTATGWIRTVAGTLAAPGLQVGEAGSGFYLVAAGAWAAVAAGVEAFRVAGGVLTFGRAVRGTPATLTDAATVTPDFAQSCQFDWTVGGNRVLANPTNLVAGQSGRIVIRWLGTYTIGLGSYWKPAANQTFDPGSGKVNRIQWDAVSSTEIHFTVLKGF